MISKDPPRLIPYLGITVPDSKWKEIKAAWHAAGIPINPPRFTIRPEGGYRPLTGNPALDAWEEGKAAWESGQELPVTGDDWDYKRLHGYQAGQVLEKVKEVTMGMMEAGSPCVAEASVQLTPAQIAHETWLSTAQVGRLIGAGVPYSVHGRKWMKAHATDADTLKKGQRYYVRKSVVDRWLNAKVKEMEDEMDKPAESEIKVEAEIPAEIPAEQEEKIVQEVVGDPMRLQKNPTHGSQRIISALNYACDHGVFLRYAFGRPVGQREPAWHAENGFEYTIVQSLELARYKDGLSVDPTKSKVHFAHDADSRFISAISHVELMINEE